MMRFLTAGESHGQGLVTIVDGLPAGLGFLREGLAAELERRRQGHGRGARMRIERDIVEILAGVRYGVTTGAPVAVLIRNTEWERFAATLSPEPGSPEPPQTTPRPGHADLAGMMKFDSHDVRDVLERASARETAARTVAGYAARLLLRAIDIEIVSHVVAIGGIEAPKDAVPVPEDRDRLDASPVRVLDETMMASMIAAIDAAKVDRDTLGGVIEVLAYGVPAGLGSYTQWDRRLDGLLARAMLSIPGIKGVEVGDAYEQARVRGSDAHDEITPGYGRATNRAGGVEGGTSNGRPIRVRAAMKPLSTLMRPLASVDVATGRPAPALRERSDVCAVPSAAVVAEQMVAIILAQEAQRSFGGATVADMQAAANAYRRRLTAF
ncbi:MAG TPA: chorismate synthase [Actinobacteria bacterium]|nr:chorismate synthase [bacterium BMS3Bbin01]HDH25699.1 chorismate synthase [Actinomycetota bacterium]